jgi:hypothetical protein
MSIVERKESGFEDRPCVLVAMALACVALACGGTETGPADAADAEPQDQAAGAETLDPQRLLEPPVDLEGELVVVYEDHADGTARLRHFLEANGGRIPLHFESESPRLLSGTRVRARGVRHDGRMALDSGRSILTLGADGGTVSGGAPAPVPNTFGEQRTVVLLVNFEDQPAEPWTVASARDLVLGTVSDFFRENSYGQTWLSGDVYGWFTIALSSTVCDGNTLAAQANAAAQAAGVDLSGYAHVVYAFQNACSGRGFGTVGGNPSQSWITGELRADVVAHELGHGLGLWHSHARDCGAVALGSTCTGFEYGHPIDTMANTAFGHFNAFHKERLGWLNYGASPAIATATSKGTYVLEAYATGGSAPHAVKVLKSTDPTTGKRTYYYVEARKALGVDAFLASNANLLGGVLVSIGSESGGDTSFLLDMTPGSGTLNVQDWADPALVAGRSFEDPGSGVTITTQWVTSTQAAISVTVGSGAAQPAQPAVTVATDRSSYTRSQSVTVTARVTTGGAAVAGAAVSFRVTKPNGTTVNATGTTASDGTARYQLRLKRQDPAGSYHASAAVTGPAPASATTTFSVQ